MTTPLRLGSSQFDAGDAKLYKQLTSDVCYLYHELIGYGYIMGDLHYANDYPLPYWTLINRIDCTGGIDDRFIRSGILVLFTAMLWDELDGSGCWISNHVGAVSSSLADFVPEDDDMMRLSASVLHGLELLRDKPQPDERFADDSRWAFNTFVRRYFEDSLQLRGRDRGITTP